MPRALPVLSAALFLSGVGAGRYWGTGRSDDSRVPAPGPAGASALRAPVDASSRAGVSAEEGQALAAKLESATLEEVSALWSALPAEDPASSGEESYTGPWGRMLILERWAELDPPGALAAVREHGGERVPRMILAVFRSWAARDQDAAMEAVKAEPAAGQLHAAAGWLSAWADEPALLARRAAELRWMNVSQLDERDFRAAVPMSLLRRVHAADREGLLALSGWPPVWYDTLLRELDWRATWSQSVERARAAVDTLVTSNNDIGPLALDLMPLFHTRPEEAMDLMERLLKKHEPLFFPVNYPVWSSPGWNAEYLLTGIVKTIGVTDPDRVARLLKEEGGRDFQVAATAAALTGLAKTNPAAALRLAAALESVAYPDESPPPPLPAATLLAAAREAPPSTLRDRWLDRALLALPPEEAAAWVDALPEGETRTAARLTLESADLPEAERSLRRVAAQASGEVWNPRIGDAAEAALEGAELPALASRVAGWPESPTRDGLVKTVVTAWAVREPADALAWTTALPDETLRASISAGVVSAWAGTDLLAASAWVDSLPPGPDREAVVNELVSGLTPRDPAAAAEWAASLTSPAMRMANLQYVLAVWSREDAEAAAAGVDAIPGLTEAERASLREYLSTP